jgi:hypothetical protein
MIKHLWLSCLTVLAVGGVACNPGSDVNREAQDLKEAEQESPQVAQELRNELEKSKAQVAKLEEKLALAEQGVTDRVLEERKDLKEAVKAEEQEVNTEVKEAQGAAQRLNQDSERARTQLERTQNAQRVQAEVTTQRKAVPAGSEVEVVKEQKQVPVETTRMIEQKKNEQARAPQP